jgi:hypothetical protein
MPWAAGQSGNPNGYSGPRNRRRHEIFQIIKDLGHKDALVTLSTLAHESQDQGTKMAAAAALAPYCHPKLQATPTPRFVENPIEVPEFTHLSDAESFLAKVAVLVARGELDFQSALELSTLVKNWIDSQYARQELDIKLVAQGGPTEQTIHITGGLPPLPGCNVTMPLLDGKPVTNGHALEPPTPVAPPLDVPAIESVPEAQEPESGGR